MAEPLERVDINKFYAMTVDGNETVGTQLGQRSIEMRHAEAKGVAHDFLRERQVKA